MFLILEFRHGTHISAVTKKNFISLLIIFSTEFERRIDQMEPWKQTHVFLYVACPSFYLDPQKVVSSHPEGHVAGNKG